MSGKKTTGSISDHPGYLKDTSKIGKRCCVIKCTNRFSWRSEDCFFTECRKQLKGESNLSWNHIFPVCRGFWMSWGFVLFVSLSLKSGTYCINVRKPNSWLRGNIPASCTWFCGLEEYKNHSWVQFPLISTNNDLFTLGSAVSHYYHQPCCSGISHAAWLSLCPSGNATSVHIHYRKSRKKTTILC